MTLLSDNEQFASLLRILHQGGSYAYWWINPGKKSVWWQALSRPKPPKGDVNVYVGVHPTTTIPKIRYNRDGQPYTPDPEKARVVLSEVAAINCLYGDFDAKDFGGDKGAALDHVEVGFAEQGVPRPSVLVDSGGGVQAYWLLDETWLLASDEDRAQADRLQKSWVSLTGADTSVKDLARVLRVVGSHNQKYADKPLVTFIWCDLDVRYSRKELAALIPPEPVKEVRQQPARVRSLSTDRLKQWVDDVIDRAIDEIRTAPTGQGNDYRVKGGKLAGGIVHTGVYTRDEIVTMLMPAAMQRSSDNERETERNIRNVIAYGEAEELEPPNFPTEHDLILKDGKARCPSCNSEVIRSKYPYPGTDTPGWYCLTCKGAMKWPYEVYTPAHAPSTARTTIDTATGEILNDSPRLELVSWHEQGITLRQLQSKVFDPEVWIIENILPEGACLFAAKYKSKKSWFSLALGCAVSMGGKALGRLDVAQGRVLYLDLEGKQQRIQKRTRAMLGVHHIPWPDNFHVFTKWPQGEKGMDQLRDWLRQYPDTRLVVIDVLNDFRRPMEKHEQFYQYDRDTVQPINELLEQYHCAGLLVHHFNKTKGNTDIFDSMTGSTGLPSAVNTMWAFERDVNDSSLTKFSLRGRDLEHDDPLALKWDDYLTQHVIEGPAAEVATSGERREVLSVLDDDTPRGPKEIAEALGKTVNAVKMLLRKLVDEGLIDKASYGKYAKVRHSGHSGHSGHSSYSGHSSEEDETKSVRSDARVSDHEKGGHSYTGHQDAVNGKSVQSVYDSKGGFISDRIAAAGWTQERESKGYRYVHAELGATAWHRTPFHAMDEADNISTPAVWSEELEGYKSEIESDNPREVVADVSVEERLIIDEAPKSILTPFFVQLQGAVWALVRRQDQKVVGTYKTEVEAEADCDEAIDAYRWKEGK